MRSSSRDTTDLSRSVGGVLFAAGAIVLYIRKSGHHPLGELALLVTVLAPALVLSALVLDGSDSQSGGERRPWRSVLTVVAILLWPLVLAQFLEVLGVRSSQPFFTVVVFAGASLIAAYGAYRTRVSIAVLLAGLGLLEAWLNLWGNVLTHLSADTVRGLLIAASALLFASAVGLARGGSIGARELATVGGIAAVAAGALGVVVGAFEGITQPIIKIVDSSKAAGHATHESISTAGFQHFGWDLYLLVVSVALVWVGSRVRARGMGYVGGLGLIAFLFSVGTQVTLIENGHSPTRSLVGWPLALLLVGAAGLAAPALNRRDRQSGEPERPI